MISGILRMIVNLTGNILIYSIFVSAILSWLPDVKLGSLRELVNSISAIVTDPFRKFLGSINVLNDLPIDLSPLLAIIFISLVMNLLNILI